MKTFIKILIFCLILFSGFSIPSYAKNSDTINVAFTIDKNYHTFALLTINSLLINNTSDSHYMFYIVEDNLSKSQKKKMKDYVESRGQNVTFININSENLVNGEKLFNTRQWLGRMTPISLARILLPELLPNDIDKVLYLDADILVLNDLKQLYNINLNGKVAGMIEDGMLPEYAFYKFKKPYFNSGVILMDLNLWRKQGLCKQMIKYMQDNMEKFIPQKDTYAYFNFPDQDLINYYLKGKIKVLDEKWNFRGLIAPYDPNVVVVHFISEYKPWVYFDREKFD